MSVVWVQVADQKGVFIGDVTHIKLAPGANVDDLCYDVISKMSKKLSHCDANDLKVFTSSANTKEDKALRRSFPVPEVTDEDKPLVIVAPGKKKNHGFPPIFVIPTTPLSYMLRQAITPFRDLTVCIVSCLGNGSL